MWPGLHHYTQCSFTLVMLLTADCNENGILSVFNVICSMPAIKNLIFVTSYDYEKFSNIICIKLLQSFLMFTNSD